MKFKRKKEIALAQGEQKNDGLGERAAKERNNFNKREIKRKQSPRKIERVLADGKERKVQ
jgi:hypothetical protein